MRGRTLAMLPHRILIVDDDPHLRQATRRVLEAAGYEILEAENGTRALEMIRTTTPALVLLDVGMPDLDGFAVCRLVKNSPEYAGTFIVMLSGSRTDSESQVSGLECGADGYITRPISNRELRARVQAFLRLKAAEDALRAKERQLRDLITCNVDGILVVDDNGVVLFVNPAALELFQRTADELVGHEIGLPVTNSAPAEITLLHPTGTTRVVEMRVARIEWQGAPAYLASLRDITERKRIEQTLREYSQRLEQMVEERTRELRAAQEQLLRQERLTMLGQIAGGIGHELRSPLSAISNAAYLLRETLPMLNEEAREALEILIHQVQVSNRILNSLLAFARPHPPTRRPTDIAALCHTVLAQATFPDHINVQCKMFEELIVNADADQLQIVFSNLIRNAVEAMLHGGTLTIEARQTQPKIVEISFRDTGVGIPPDHLDKIFRPMFTTRKHGLGLGLPLCKLIVEAHGGTISVTSQEGKGTTFTIALPLNTAESPEEA
ncbi:MAG: response regulator [Anaerolineae bacterium]|nr:response regulator [Anaerolineae bacterium]